MRKQLRLMTSLFMLCVTALFWAGCSSGYQGWSDDCCVQEEVCAPMCAPVNNTVCCPPACPPVCAPRCAPAPVCRPPVCPPRCAPAPCGPPVCPPACNVQPAPCCPQPCAQVNMHGTASSQICTDGVMVSVSQPTLCILGDNYALDLTVTACVDVCHAEVHAMLPEGVTLVRSEPAGVAQTADGLTWSFSKMKKGEVQKSRIILRADREGGLCVCFCVTAVPVQFCALICAKPVLECSKCGPEEVCPGDPIHYTISVTNKGTCAAEEVVVTDLVPDGIEHASGQRTLVFKLGTLEPCQTKKINACFTAVKRGKVCNTINVTACNANPTSCQWCTCICCCGVDITKTGPKEVPIGKTADYQIVVSNTGDKVLTDVVVTDNAPSATSIVEAKGAVINGNQAVWRFNELKPGEKQNLVLTLTTCTPGYFVNKVCVDDCQHCTACAEWGTRWKGRPALNICIEEAEDPICIGQFNTYIIRVVNQGSEEDSNVNVVVRFPAEIQPVSAYGATPGQVSGQTVTFAPVKILGSRQTLEFRVEAQAKSSGDARIKLEVSSDSIKTPITQEESTIVN